MLNRSDPIPAIAQGGKIFALNPNKYATCFYDNNLDDYPHNCKDEDEKK